MNTGPAIDALRFPDGAEREWRRGKRGVCGICETVRTRRGRRQHMQMGSLGGTCWPTVAGIRWQRHGALMRLIGIAIAAQTLDGGERGAVLAGIGANTATATDASSSGCAPAATAGSLVKLLILHVVAHQHFRSAAAGEDNLLVHVAHVAARSLQYATLGRLWWHRWQKAILKWKQIH